MKYIFQIKDLTSLYEILSQVFILSENRYFSPFDLLFSLNIKFIGFFMKLGELKKMNKRIQSKYVYSSNKTVNKNKKSKNNKLFPKKDYEPYIPKYDGIDAL